MQLHACAKLGEIGKLSGARIMRPCHAVPIHPPMAEATGLYLTNVEPKQTVRTASR